MLNPNTMKPVKGSEGRLTTKIKRAVRIIITVHCIIIATSCIIIGAAGRGNGKKNICIVSFIILIVQSLFQGIYSERSKMCARVGAD